MSEEFDLDVFGYHHLYNLVRGLTPKLTPKPVPEVLEVLEVPEVPEVPVLPVLPVLPVSTPTPVDQALVNNTSRLESATFFVRNEKLNKNMKETLIRSTEADMNSIYHALKNSKFP